MQKFSSNVIEKCMDRASEEMIVKYVHELADPAAMRPLLQVKINLHTYVRADKQADRQADRRTDYRLSVRPMSGQLLWVASVSSLELSWIVLAYWQADRLPLGPFGLCTASFFVL